MKKIDHGNIVKVVESFENKSTIFIVMELFTGVEIFEYISKQEKFTENDAIAIIKQVLDATATCHQNGIAHRDLKPANILIDPEAKGLIKIIDFGIAQSQFDVEELSDDIVFGTPYYNAPEVLICEFSRMSDMWSIGVILYTMLCGDPPFAGSNDNKIMSLIDNAAFDYDPTYWRDKSE